MRIYKTVNLINGKIYIGKDTNDRDKYVGSGIILQSAIEKYGIENFKKEILEKCKTEKLLNEREKYWIAELDSLAPNGYNISNGGLGGDTFTNNPNKEKIRNKQRGHIPWNKGKHLTYEIKEKISKTKKKFFINNPDKKINSGSYKSGKNHIHYGKKRNPEIYKKIVNTRRKTNSYANNNTSVANKINCKKIYYENLKTGDKILFNSQKEAVEYTKIPRCIISDKMNKNIIFTKKYKYIIIKHMEI